MVSVILSVGAFVAGQFVRSPWEDAEANAEQTIVATAPVVLGELQPPETSAIGTASMGSVITVSVAASDGALSVVTAQRVAPGDAIASAQLITEVSGRPVFALALPFPLYRDLHPGDHGVDVLAVQAALQSLGHYAGPLDGLMGEGTQSALTKLYTALGNVPPEASQEAKDALAAAQETYNSLKAQAVDARTPSGGTDPIHAASAALSEARLAAGPWLPLAEVVAIPDGPVTVANVAPVGTVLTDEVPAASLRAGTPSVTARVGVDDAGLFEPGATVLVQVLGLPEVLKGTVSSISDFQPGEDAAVPGYDVQVALADAPGVTEGASATVSPETAAAAQSGLVVPLTAVREDDEGPYVLVVAEPERGEQADGYRRVSIEPGLSADGRILVVGDMREGQLVVVGESG